MLLRPLTPADILNRYIYDYTSGAFYRRSGPHAGERAETKTTRGYRNLDIMGRRFAAHRVVWFLEYGDWPRRITHINGDHADNRPENLTTSKINKEPAPEWREQREAKRPAHTQLRSKGRRPVAPSKSGVKHIYQNAYSGWWYAKIKRGGKWRTSPCVPTIAEAQSLLADLMEANPEE